MNLAQRSTARARENDRLVLEALAAAGDQGLQPKQLPEASGLSERTARASVGRLESRALVTRQGERGRIYATMAGRGEASAKTPGTDLLPDLTRAIACFPAEAQRAFARLLLAGIVAKYHLASVYSEGWGGFICTGPTNTAKTALAAFACRAFGLDHRRAVRLTGNETPGSLFARRIQTTQGWDVEPSPLLKLPFLCLDEWDKASEEIRRDGGRLLLGYTQPEQEGRQLLARPAVMVCLNTRPGELGRFLHDAHVRRSVVLDTSPLGGLLADIDEAMRELFGPGRIPRVDLASTRPPLDRLDLAEADRAALRAGLRHGLTDEGWRLCDVEALSRLVLGRAALVGDGDLQRVAIATAFDYLATATTVPGHTQPGALADLARQLGCAGPLAPDVATAEEQLQRRSRIEADKEARDREQRIQYEAERERRRVLLLEAKGRLRRMRDPEARAVAKALAELAKDLSAARSSDSLERIWLGASGWLEKASRIRRERDEATALVARRRRAEHQSRQVQRASIRAEKQHQAEYRRQERPKWSIWRKRLAALIPVESSVELMDRLDDANLVKWIPPPPPPPGSNLWGKLGHTLRTRGHYIHIRTGRQVDFTEAPSIWLQEWHHANRQVVALGGRPATPPEYREVSVLARSTNPLRPRLRRRKLMRSQRPGRKRPSS